jgi:hypothetical protein
MNKHHFGESEIFSHAMTHNSVTGRTLLRRSFTSANSSAKCFTIEGVEWP